MPYDAAPDASRSRPQLARTLLRGLSVLEQVAVADDQGLSVTALARRADMDKSTASRVLATLRAAGYVRQDPRRRYHLTSKLSRLAAGRADPRDVATVARPTLTALHARYDEEIHLAVLDGGAMSFIDFLSSTQPVRANLSTAPAPIHRLAVGIAVLAELDETERAEVVQQSLREAGERTNASARRRLERLVGQARDQGWAGYDTGDDVARVACAFHGSDDRPLGALCLSGPAYRLAPRLAEAAGDVRAAAAEITARLR